MIALGLIVAALAQAQAQAPQIVADGEKITVRALDLELIVGTASGATPISVSLIATAIAELQASASADDTVTAALVTRITAVEVRNALLESRLDNASLEDDMRDELMANTATATTASLEQLRAQVAQLSAAVASKAEQNALINLERTLSASLLANSTAMIAALTLCQAQGGILSSAGACRVQSTTTRVFPCGGATVHNFQVPAGVGSIHAKLWGGGGSGSAWNTGGAGGYVEGDFNVTANEVIAVAVACPPAADQVCLGSCGNAWFQPGWPGMATADLHGNTGATFAGSPGGGYSGLFRGQGGMSQDTAVAVAAGGGGGGGGPVQSGEHVGGAGGGDAGEDGTVAGGSTDSCDRGRGGTQDAGGEAGCLSGGASNGMSAGQALLSGLGDDGGSGGSGWFGGGGGSRGGSWLHAGGGGGSSWTGGMENATSAMGHRNILSGAATRPSSGYVQGVGRGGAGTVGGPGLVILKFRTTRDV